MDKKNFDSKVYCCSNSAKTEAKTMGVIDVILYVIALLCSVWLTDLVKNHPEYVKTAFEVNNGTYCDYQGVFDKIEADPDLTSGLLIIASVCGMALGALLFHAARTGRRPLLKLWFALTLISLLLKFLASVILLTEVRYRIPVVVMVLIGFLYAWYEMWIVVKLVREVGNESSVKIMGISNTEESLVGVQNSNAGNSDNNTLAPQDPIYTIEGAKRDIEEHDKKEAS